MQLFRFAYRIHYTFQHWSSFWEVSVFIYLDTSERESWECMHWFAQQVISLGLTTAGIILPGKPRDWFKWHCRLRAEGFPVSVTSECGSHPFTKRTLVLQHGDSSSGTMFQFRLSKEIFIRKDEDDTDFCYMVEGIENPLPISFAWGELLCPRAQTLMLLPMRSKRFCWSMC